MAFDDVRPAGAQAVIEFYPEGGRQAEPSTLPGDLEGKIARVEAVLLALLRRGTPLCVSWSAGKDSSTLLNLVLVAAAKLAKSGVRVPPIVVTHADTLVENPEMVLYAQTEMMAVRDFARANGLKVRIDVSRPNLTDQWPVRVIGGRALPSFASGARDCTPSLKIAPMERLRKRVLKELALIGAKSDAEPAVMIGTRYEESVERAKNMRERGESDVQVRRGVDTNGRPSSMFLSPIAFWTADDVWEYLGTVKAGAIPGYSTFEETFRVYADAMGTSCAVVAEDMSRAMKASKGCGARHGCSLCTVVQKDQSMENMIAQPRYEYMAGLNRLRNFLVDTRWDMTRRSWLGRTIKDGYVRIGPDAYSPQMMEDLLKYALTIDVIEEEAARRAGLRGPRFRLVGYEQLFAIDAMWSLQAFHRPFHAIKIFKDVRDKDERYPVPQVAASPRPPEIPSRYLKVGKDWEDGFAYTYTGLRSVLQELVKGEGDGCMGTRVTSNGTEVIDIDVGSMLNFDLDAASYVFDEDFSRAMAKHDDPKVLPTEAYHYYLTMGGMSVKAGMEAEIDSILRRSNFKIREGLAGQIDHRPLWNRALPAAEAGVTPSRSGAKRARGGEGSLSVAFGVPLVPGAEQEAADEDQDATGEARVARPRMA